MQEIKESTQKYVELDMERRVLDKMLDIVSASLKTNVYYPDRFAFAVKLKPEVCMDELDTLRT